MVKTIANILLFLTWPIVLPIKTIRSSVIRMGLTYVLGIAIGILFVSILPPQVQVYYFTAIAVLTGLVWGHWIAEDKEIVDSDLGRFISTLVAGMLLAYGVQLFF